MRRWRRSRGMKLACGVRRSARTAAASLPLPVTGPRGCGTLTQSSSWSPASAATTYAASASLERSHSRTRKCGTRSSAGVKTCATHVIASGRLASNITCGESLVGRGARHRVCADYEGGGNRDCRSFSDLLWMRRSFTRSRRALRCRRGPWRGLPAPCEALVRGGLCVRESSTTLPTASADRRYSDPQISSPRCRLGTRGVGFIEASTPKSFRLDAAAPPVWCRNHRSRQQAPFPGRHSWHWP